MNPLLNGNNEVNLLVNDEQKIVALDGLEQWQADQLITPNSSDSPSYASHCLSCVDKVVRDWLKELTPEQWAKINRQQSLFGIPIPQDWIKVWRIILKEPSLRDAEAATRGGRGIGTFLHCWNMWAEDCLDRFLDDLDKDLLRMVDEGWLYAEIGEYMVKTYGDKFWKKRKKESKTTPSQVVNNYLHWKLPNKITRAELTEMVLGELRQRSLE